jgi:hypothetical protein
VQARLVGAWRYFRTHLHHGGLANIVSSAIRPRGRATPAELRGPRRPAGAPIRHMTIQRGCASYGEGRASATARAALIRSIVAGVNAPGIRRARLCRGFRYCRRLRNLSERRWATSGPRWAARVLGTTRVNVGGVAVSRVVRHHQPRLCAVADVAAVHLASGRFHSVIDFCRASRRARAVDRSVSDSYG